MIWILGSDKVGFSGAGIAIEGLRYGAAAEGLEASSNHRALAPLDMWRGVSVYSLLLQIVCTHVTLWWVLVTIPKVGISWHELCNLYGTT